MINSLLLRLNLGILVSFGKISGNLIGELELLLASVLEAMSSESCRRVNYCFEWMNDNYVPGIAVLRLRLALVEVCFQIVC